MIGTLPELREFLRARLAEGRKTHYGAVRRTWAEASEDYFWDEAHQDWRVALIARHGVRPGAQRILDLASGCGQFVLLALSRGYDCEGVEPEPWRVQFVARKIDLLGHPANWKPRFHQAVAEHLPFADDTFDYVTSFQTLEHVADPKRAISEMIRVTRPGGMVHMMCPDYRSAFEAHYQLPWLPMFPRGLARSYLRMLRRPVQGLESIRYVTGPRIRKWIAEAHTARAVEVLDENRQAFAAALRRRGLAAAEALYPVWRTLLAIRYAGRRELSVSLLVRVLAK